MFEPHNLVAKIFDLSADSIPLDFDGCELEGMVLNYIAGLDLGKSGLVIEDQKYNSERLLRHIQLRTSTGNKFYIGMLEEYYSGNLLD